MDIFQTVRTIVEDINDVFEIVTLAEIITTTTFVSFKFGSQIILHRKNKDFLTIRKCFCYFVCYSVFVSNICKSKYIGIGRHYIDQNITVYPSANRCTL
ncbi:hypothetical protein SDC9_189816 [bioreactor metagenome]|uniref:Uncharacterized protein n=1 Tax=bioreactor metagenome TaxID=1076179 RepID=A0A645HTS8_9ZZZZ